MENASKALIIAGAILLSILIIALGVFVFNQAKSSIGNTGLSDQEVAAFNSKFDSYEGKQLGSSVRSLVTQVNNYNRTVNDGRYIIITEQKTGNDFAETATEYNKNDYSAGKQYEVSFAYNKGGLIYNIIIPKTEK